MTQIKELSLVNRVCFPRSITKNQSYHHLGPVSFSRLTLLPRGPALALPTAPTQSAAPADGPWLSPPSHEEPDQRPGRSASSWCPGTGSLVDCWPCAQRPASVPAPVAPWAGAAEAAPRPGPGSCPEAPAAPVGLGTRRRGDARCAAGSRPLGSEGPVRGTFIKKAKKERKRGI